VLHAHLNEDAAVLGKCDQAELQEKISLYTDMCKIPETNIMIHPDNGGDPLLYGYMYLGIPVGSDEYKKRQLRIIMLLLNHELEGDFI
jgi:hypothetical protein